MIAPTLLLCMSLGLGAAVGGAARAPAAAPSTSATPGITPSTPGSTPSSTPSATSATSEARRIQRLVVTDFELDDTIAPRTARIVVNNLVVELRKLGGYSVIGMDEVRALLDAEANRQSMGCSEDGASCLAELADALGADVVVTGRIGTLAGATVLSLRRLDTARSSVVGSFEERLLPQQGEELLAAVGPAVEQLFPEATLRPGEARGVAAEQPRILNPPPLPPPLTVAVGATAVGAAAAGGALWVLSTQTITAGQLLVDTADGRSVSGPTLARYEADASTFATTAVIAASAGAGLLVVAGVMALFTDWTGLAAEEP